MKKTILSLFSLVLLVFLAACGSQSAENDAAASTAETTQRATPPSMQLMLGTVKLDETEYAIDAAQAAELLPLWKALRSINESETAAQLEVDALIAQIEDTMTPEQISAIEAMGLTMQDMASVAETLGIEMGGFGGFGEMTPEMQATMEAMRESGDFPAGGGEMPAGGEMPGGGAPGGGEMPGGGAPGGGGMPGGGMPGGGFGGAESDSDADTTTTRGGGFGLNTALLDAIIEFLEGKLQ